MPLQPPQSGSHVLRHHPRCSLTHFMPGNKPQKNTKKKFFLMDIARKRVKNELFHFFFLFLAKVLTVDGYIWYACQSMLADDTLSLYFFFIPLPTFCCCYCCCCCDLSVLNFLIFFFFFDGEQKRKTPQGHVVLLGLFIGAGRVR